MLHYDPLPDCTREYVEDAGGSLLFCRDYGDEMFHAICWQAKRLLVRIPEQSEGDVHPRIKELAQAVQSIVIANTKVPAAKESLNLPRCRDLAEVRQKVLLEVARRTLIGVDKDESGHSTVVLCFVPPSVRDCDLILDL